DCGWSPRDESDTLAAWAVRQKELGPGRIWTSRSIPGPDHGREFQGHRSEGEREIALRLREHVPWARLAAVGSNPTFHRIEGAEVCFAGGELLAAAVEGVVVGGVKGAERLVRGGGVPAVDGDVDGGAGAVAEEIRAAIAGGAGEEAGPVAAGGVQADEVVLAGGVDLELPEGSVHASFI